MRDDKKFNKKINYDKQIKIKLNSNDKATYSNASSFKYCLQITILQ